MKANDDDLPVVDVFYGKISSGSHLDWEIIFPQKIKSYQPRGIEVHVNLNNNLKYFFPLILISLFHLHKVSFAHFLEHFLAFLSLLLELDLGIIVCAHRINLHKQLSNAL